jgi:polysaccharide deacetylase family protein (PEP-CTERM system associated)
VRNALTIDVEEYFQAHAYANVVDRADWERIPGRVVANVQRLLALLAEHGTRATFFVLGWVADRHPELVREIAAGGHEVGSHGYSHQLLDRQSPEEFADDLARSLAAIGRALGRPDALLGYRTLWALDILRAHGIRYDSSLQPVLTRAGNGVYGASRFAARLDAGLWEFPVSTMRLAGYNCPVAGGAWFRVLPLWMTRRAIERINMEGRPAVVYLHPWEVDPEEPVVPRAPFLAQLRHRLNLGRTEGRLRRLLAERPFGPLREVFAAELAQA